MGSKKSIAEGVEAQMLRNHRGREQLLITLTFFGE
jgi:hypothetical protein